MGDRDITEGMMDVFLYESEQLLEQLENIALECEKNETINESNVNEIISLPKITKVPETPEYVKGLINLRGKIIPVIDVRIRFGKEQLTYNDRTCVIVITVDNVVIGFIVDKIEEVLTIAEDSIVPPPHMVNNSGASRFVYGIGKIGEEVKLLIDPVHLICEEEQELFVKLSGTRE